MVLSKTQERTKTQSEPETTAHAEDPYTVLNIPQTATKEEITDSYRTMARMYHPDKMATMGWEFGKLAHEKMQAINDAYEELKKRF